MTDPISKIFAVPHIVGAVAGVELEMEGRNFPPEHRVPGWKAVPDGSLRSGIEYVLAAPQGAIKLKESLMVMKQAFEECSTKREYSFRTSTHIHVNVSNLTMDQVKAILVLYYLFENQYTGFCAKHRQGNRFCLRLREAEAITGIVASFVQTGRVPSQEHAKYMALNLATLSKYGTLEFRTLEGTDDWDRIYTWVRALLRLRKAGKEVGSIKDFKDKSAEELAELLFPTDRLKAQFLKDGWEVDVEYQRSLMLDILNS